MTFSPIGLLLGSVLAERQGVADPRARTRLALLGGMFGGGSPITSMTMTTVLARREVGESSQRALVVLPDVQELGLAEARQRLESLGLEVATRDVHSKAAVGSVTNQNPDPNSVVLEGDKVTLYVSVGVQEDSLVDLPNLVGLDFEVARQTLHDIDLRVERVDVNVDPDDKEHKQGQVVAQEPAYGKVEPEIQVTLSVCNRNGPPPVN